MRPLLAIVLFVLALVGCDSPTTCPCRDGRDCSGRGPITGLRTECRPSGTALLCQATRFQQGYCAGASLDVTSSTMWTSSNPQIADFDKGAPGVLNVFGVGDVQISARLESLKSDAMTVFVSPDSAPRQDTSIEVYVERAGSVPRTRIPDAQIEIAPDGAPSLRCSTNQTGRCNFHPRMTILGSVDVSVTKADYAPVMRQQRAISRIFSFTVVLTPLGE